MRRRRQNTWHTHIGLGYNGCSHLEPALHSNAKSQPQWNVWFINNISMFSSPHPPDIPMVWVRAAIGRRSWVTNLLASIRISMMLLMRANRGARGKAATNIVTKPNCSTETEYAQVAVGGDDNTSVSNHGWHILTRKELHLWHRKPFWGDFFLRHLISQNWRTSAIFQIIFWLKTL